MTTNLVCPVCGAPMEKYITGESLFMPFMPYSAVYCNSKLSECTRAGLLAVGGIRGISPDPLPDLGDA